MAPPPPELMEELVEEVLLRFPPDDPASLARAALVCKRWCQLVCGAAFRRRFREFHRGAAPLLGLLRSGSCGRTRRDGTPRPMDTDRRRRRTIKLVDIVRLPMAYFVPTTSFRPAHAAAAADDSRYDGCCTIDVRHGRVLLCRHHRLGYGWHHHGDLCVWDPVTDEQRDLPEPPFYLQIAAVACAATAGDDDCEHLDCRRGPFLIVAMGMQYEDGMHLSVYSSEAGAWSKVSVCEGPSASCHVMSSSLPGVLVRRALYILVHCKHELTMHHEIVKYDLATRQVSMIQLPSKLRRWKRSIVLMTDDGGGGLGFAANAKHKVQLWSRVAAADGAESADGDAGFVLTEVIDLQKMLPSIALVKKKPRRNDFAVIKMPQVNGFADGGACRVLFIRTYDGLYSIDMNSSQVKKLANSPGDHDDVVPYIGFCTPTSRVQH